mmetsp:Transcript_23085/g.56086  ORF Transcript_23085/g.56086 Transcript_23085/m.56086 type:complete len:221 (+) Transcript_23085:104-766(+)
MKLTWVSVVQAGAQSHMTLDFQLNHAQGSQGQQWDDVIVYHKARAQNGNSILAIEVAPQADVHLVLARGEKSMSGSDEQRHIRTGDSDPEPSYLREDAYAGSQDFAPQRGYSSAFDESSLFQRGNATLSQDRSEEKLGEKEAKSNTWRVLLLVLAAVVLFVLGVGAVTFAHYYKIAKQREALEAQNDELIRKLQAEIKESRSGKVKTPLLDSPSQSSLST